MITDKDLLQRFTSLVDGDRRNAAAMLVDLAEIDRRQIWASEGYPSMFAWCTERFHMSSSKAGKRICASRYATRFPLAVEMIARGELHVSGLVKIGKHLTEENHRQVLARAKHKTERQLDELVVELAPKPDAPTRITRVTSPAASPISSLFSAEHKENEIRTSPARAPSKVEPLSPGRFKVQVTVGAETHDKLKRLQSLLSHATTDPAEIIDRALDELLEATLRKRAAATMAPRKQKSRTENTRVIPAAVKREVWKRDDASCAFTSNDGHRCRETRLLQIHHRRPFARGGEATSSNLELRCAAHNQHEARRDYGELFMRTKIEAAHSARNAQRSHTQ